MRSEKIVFCAVLHKIAEFFADELPRNIDYFDPHGGPIDDIKVLRRVGGGGGSRLLVPTYERHNSPARELHRCSSKPERYNV